MPMRYSRIKNRLSRFENDVVAEVSPMAINLWDRVNSIVGQTLETLSRRKPFKIVRVGSDHVVVKPSQSKGGNLSVRRADIERIAEMGWHHDELRSRTAAELPECGVTSYVAAIVYEVTRTSKRT